MDILLIVLAVLFILGFIFIPILFRKVVPTNEVHIVQRNKTTVSYGKDTSNGNIYYLWPSWIPFLGISVTKLPVNVFSIDLDGYEAYDQGRLPFVVDIKAFFRISHFDIAAQRIATITEFEDQLTSVVQGAVRAVLAGSDIEEIMQGRSQFGTQFTNEVKEQLLSWGVEPVKNIELMDLRDSKSSFVIHNIMEKKKSFIEKESRQAVALNHKVAQISEIEADREVKVQEQEALQQVGIKTTETERNIALIQEKKKQEVSETAKLTTEKEMEVKRIADVRTAEIMKQVEVVKAEQHKQVLIIEAEANFENVKKRAEADLESVRKKSEGIELEGFAVAGAEKAKLLAPVDAQITLAKEIGANMHYQNYLISVEQIKANKEVGMEQAKALCNAEIKVIANTGNASTGLNSIKDIFSAQGGTQVGTMLEGLANTETGQKVLNKLGVK